METSTRFTTEQIAYWFFRLNGCLNIVNFLVHHERQGREGTDVDILAARFPYRCELAMSNFPMEDHPVFRSDGLIDLIIAEVKSGRCALNGPWKDPVRRNMDRVLFAVGAFPEAQVPKVAQALYEEQAYEDSQYRVRLFALGRERSNYLESPVVQLTWEEVLDFIYERFTKYSRTKAQHRQWDRHGQALFRKAMECESARHFVRFVMERMGSR